MLFGSLDSMPTGIVVIGKKEEIKVEIEDKLKVKNGKLRVLTPIFGRVWKTIAFRLCNYALNTFINILILFIIRVII